MIGFSLSVVKTSFSPGNIIDVMFGFQEFDGKYVSQLFNLKRHSTY
jgi:hypothetical protein